MWGLGVSIAAATLLLQSLSLTATASERQQKYYLRPNVRQLDFAEIVDGIVAGEYKKTDDQLLFMRPREGALNALAWKVSHVDDMLFGMGVGAASWIFNIKSAGFREMRKVADGESVKGIKAARRSVKEKFVVYSDHHLLGHLKKHDYFSTFKRDGAGNKRIEAIDLYKQALDQYYQNGYTLVEAGDVEDLVTIEPQLKVGLVDQLFDTVGLMWGELFDEKFESGRKKLQLVDIFYNYQELYKQIGGTFIKDNRFVKLVGNHDIKLKNKNFLDLIRRVYQTPDLQVFDYLLIDGVNELNQNYPQFVVAHGHQIDPWCNDDVAKLVSESFTQSEAWFGSGADRIWPKYEGGKGGWFRKMNAEVGFDNTLALAPSMEREKGMTTKFRHMGERNLEKHMEHHFKDAPNTPTLVLGHTHEPKVGAVNKKGVPFAKYLNTGATGHYEQLIWCVEIVDGVGTLWAHYVDADGKIVKRQMVPTDDGRLIPKM